MNDTMTLDPKFCGDVETQELIESEPVTTDYQSLVSDKVVDVTYLAINKLKYFDPADPWFKETIEMPSVGVLENDGCILYLRGTARKSMKGDGSYEQVGLTELGEEIGEIEADRRQGIIQRPIPRYKVYEWRIWQVTETDGPALREELLQSYETWKQDQKKQKLEDLSASKDLASAMREFAGNLKGGNMTEEQVLAQALDKMTPEMLIELAEQKKESTPEPKQRGWPKGKPRKV